MMLRFEATRLKEKLISNIFFYNDYGRKNILASTQNQSTYSDCSGAIILLIIGIEDYHCRSPFDPILSNRYG